MSGKCKYAEKYYWDELHKQHVYHCTENPMESGYCIFHDPDYLRPNSNDFESHKKELEIAFAKKLSYYLNEKKEEDWFFIGYIIPGFNLDNVTISGNVYFMYTKFMGPLKFRNLNFNGKASFIGADFASELIINNCQFNLKAEFDNAHFHGDSIISSSEFHGETTFHSSKFFDDFSCSNIKFRKVDFGYAEFNKEAEFGNTIFFGQAHFHDSKFNKFTSFHDSQFRDILLFNSTDSNAIAITNSIFHNVFFSHAKVKSLLQFWQSKFLEEVDFSKSQFVGKIDFRRCQFEGLLNFDNTAFGEVDFSYSIFKGAAYFIESKFLKPSFFNYVRFEHPGDIIFQRTDLSNVSFVNTDLSRINFGENVRFGKDSPFKIFDEERLINYIDFKKENERSKVNLGNVLSLYRGLRENFEYRLRYDESSYFFINEMDLKRKYREV